jgi:hypothetical protein
VILARGLTGRHRRGRELVWRLVAWALLTDPTVAEAIEYALLTPRSPFGCCSCSCSVPADTAAAPHVRSLRRSACPPCTSGSRYIVTYLPGVSV